MSAKFEPQWQERRANIDPKTGARQERLLVIGTDADKIAGAFAKLLPQCHIQSATRADHAILAMSSGHFDATLVDCRDDERFHRLAIVAARQFKQGRVALLASDHFLPDETAVIENLDIFSSSDDSTKLLASLRLEPKRPARKRKAAAPRGAEDSAGFEAALRAELDALHARPAESLPIAPAQIMASAPPAIGEASGTASWKMPHRVWRAEARVLVPAGGEAAQADDPGFLDTLASELEQVELFEDVAETSVQTEGQSARLDYASGNIDLFGNPASNLNEIRLLAGEADANGAAESVVGATDSAFEGPDLFDAAATAQAAAEARACALALEAEAAETAISLAVDEISQALDSLMASEPEGFSISVPAPEIEPQLEAAETSPSQAIGSRDLFGGEIDAALQRGASAGDEIETSGGARCPETMDLFAAPVLPEAMEAAETPFVALVESGRDAEATLHAVFPVSEELPQPSAKTALLRSTSWIAHLLPRLTPLYSVVYKNLALVILGALFTAFVAFGVMIVFFLTSNKWSAPITLSRGHELVSKAERELSDLNVRRNQISEQIDDAQKNLKSSQEQLSRAEQLAGMIEGTISAEISNRKAMRGEIETHTEALRRIAAQYGNDTLNPAFKGNLSREFDRRLINRNIFEAGKLAQLEAAHRTALIRNEIAGNEVEIARLNSTLAALSALSGHVEGTQTPTSGVGGADLVPLLNQVIEVRKGTAQAASELSAAESRTALLTNSLQTVDASVTQIRATPLARAINENITVLFVPYENAGQYQQGNVLYSCAIGIFFCTEAGKVGKTIEGETVATHPFFNKPVRGSFVEAELTDQDAARKEILHVKRRPLFF